LREPFIKIRNWALAKLWPKPREACLWSFRPGRAGLPGWQLNLVFGADVLHRMKILIALFLVALAAASPRGEAQPAAAPGVPVAFQLPLAGPLPQNYLVTLVVLDAKNPDWIVSTFVAGARREVTAENGGRFTETWDGLDDNFMPVPPGEYAVRGIYAPAKQW
jgi:hypothetical protein